jgi:serine protease Do
VATVIQEHIAQAPGLNAAMTHLAATLQAATVEVRVDGHGNGSGVVWRNDGMIITNSHVVRGDAADVILADGRRLPAQVVDRSADQDLVSLRVAADNLQAAPIGDSSKLRVGQLVLAMGHPLGVKDALTLGIVHMVPTLRNGHDEQRWIRADLSLLPGNSGGPMVDASGSVIGINSMVVGELALAIPSNTVERFIAGAIKPAYLGVQTQAVRLAHPISRPGYEQETGLMVLEVLEGGPAIRNGLLPGDILIAAAGAPLPEHESLLHVLRRCSAGTPLPLTIIRGGVTLEVTAILGERDTHA